METNEVQWHPPEQFLSAAPEVQTTSDDKVHVPGHEGEKEGEQHRQDDEENSEAKGVFVWETMCLFDYIYISFYMFTFSKVSLLQFSLLHVQPCHSLFSLLTHRSD